MPTPKFNVVGRLQTRDEAGNIETVIEYRIVQGSDEIRSDRMTADPSIEKAFRTADGREVEQIDEDTFVIFGTTKTLRRVK